MKKETRGRPREYRNTRVPINVRVSKTQRKDFNRACDVLRITSQSVLLKVVEQTISRSKKRG